MPNRTFQTSSWKQNNQNKKYKIAHRRLVVTHHVATSPTKQKAPKNKNTNHNFFIALLLNKKFLKFTGLAALVGLIGFIILVLVVNSGLPNPNQLINREVAQSTKIYDRTGQNLLYEISGDQKRTLVKISDLPNYVKQATISVEDKDFYKHGGISVWAMIRTMITNIIFRRSAGGSTLTQQFVKNAILSNEKTFTRKLKEIILAIRIEQKFSKDEILQMYLNEIPYGSNAYGVEAAAQKYFKKQAKDLTIAEAAVLAALPQAPSRYSPYGPNKQLLLDRQKYILGLMAEQGYITKDQADTAKKEVIKFAPPDSNMIAPHFIMYIKDQLAEKYGEQAIEQGGLKIITTLDLYKQKIAEEVITQKTENYKTKYNASNAALVSIDPKTGQILAMVGSRDYFDDSIDGQVNIATSLRQPGSSIKPLVYATLFGKGYTPNTILFDVNTNFSNNGTPYEPHDYDLKERGPVSIRTALAGSLNIPAVKALYLAGVKNVTDLAAKFGYTTLTNPDRYGLSLVLGGGEVKMLEHVNAFGVFAREGEYHQVASILRVEDKDGKVLEEYKDQKDMVLDPKIAEEVNSILTDNAARTPIFGAKNFLTLPDRLVAAKTGTTNDFKDAWTMGFTPSLVTGVWVGNNSSVSMKKGSDGSIVAAPIWNEYMKRVLVGTPVEAFKDPGDLTTGKAVIDGESNVNRKVLINTQTNTIATSSTPPELTKEVIYTNPHCILYYVNKDDPLGPKPSDPSIDPQFPLWESAVLTWAQKNNIYASSSKLVIGDSAPTNPPQFDITGVADKDIIKDSKLNIGVNITSIADNANVEYYINNNLTYKTSVFPFTMNKTLNFLSNGYYNLKVKVCDASYNCTEKSLEFNLLLDNNYQNTPALNLISPSSGTIASASDFPLNIQLATNNYEKVTKVDLFYKDASGVNPIKSLTSVTDKIITLSWDSSPGPGTYEVYAEYYDWNNNKKTSNSITLNVN
ncbi:MAG: penicillin-binding protein [Candidatus Falkowbacteria bacterium]